MAFSLKSAYNSEIGNIFNSKSKNSAQRALLQNATPIFNDNAAFDFDKARQVRPTTCTSGYMSPIPSVYGFEISIQL